MVCSWWGWNPDVLSLALVVKLVLCVCLDRTTTKTPRQSVLQSPAEGGTAHERAGGAAGAGETEIAQEREWGCTHVRKCG